MRGQQQYIPIKPIHRILPQRVHRRHGWGHTISGEIMLILQIHPHRPAYQMRLLMVLIIIIPVLHLLFHREFLGIGVLFKMIIYGEILQIRVWHGKGHVHRDIMFHREVRQILRRNGVTLILLLMLLPHLGYVHNQMSMIVCNVSLNYHYQVFVIEQVLLILVKILLVIIGRLL